MNPTLFATSVALLAVAASALLVAWLSRRAALASEKRMMQMLTCSGVESGSCGHEDAWAILQVARGRCRGCRSAELCDRWLAGKVGGDNGFCRNTQMFGVLRRITGRVAASVRTGHPAAATLPSVARNVVRTGRGYDPSLLLSPSIKSPIAAVL